MAVKLRGRYLIASVDAARGAMMSVDFELKKTCKEVYRLAKNGLLVQGDYHARETNF